MDYYLFIGILSSIVWTIVPFFQIKSRYFFYFSILAYSAFYSILYLLLPLPVPSRNIITISMLAIPGLFPNFFRKNIVLLIGLGIVLFFIALILPFKTIQLIGLINFTISEIILIRQFVNQILNEKRLNLFNLIIIIYGLFNVIKFVYIITLVSNGLTVYFTLSAIQILIGVGLFFLKEDNPKMNFNLK